MGIKYPAGRLEEPSKSGLVDHQESYLWVFSQSFLASHFPARVPASHGVRKKDLASWPRGPFSPKRSGGPDPPGPLATTSLLGAQSSQNFQELPEKYKNFKASDRKS